MQKKILQGNSLQSKRKWAMAMDKKEIAKALKYMKRFSTSPILKEQKLKAP